MTAALLVALGGALGSLARWALSGWVLENTLGWRFPAGTFLVNLIGCLVIGVLAGLAIKHDLFSTDTRLFLFTGICGGFTTFSTFGLDTFYLLRRSEIAVAGGYVAGSVVFGLLAVWLGYAVVSGRG
ncbi:MAG: fluoride efflux transporter CrcB [Gemmatimonadota bacterium]|jgi:CrcB protein|nr:fluoride efflux transporter CrcB [Gemmatimonadota bacterium]